MSSPVRVIKPSEFAAPEGSKTTELANARRLVAQHGEDLRYCKPWDAWIFWNGRRWTPDLTGELPRRAKATSASIYKEASAAGDPGERAALARWAALSESERAITNMIRLAWSEPGIPVLPEELDSDPWLLNARNGTIDLRTGKLRPHRREDLITKLAPVDYDPAALCPTWDAVLARALPDADVRLFLQRLGGYALTGETSEQIVVLAHGSGANSKTTVVNALLEVWGDYAQRTDFGTFLDRDHDGPRNDLAALKGARLVPAVEVEAGRKLSEVVVKEITGGDHITCRFLHREFFTYKPTFKVILAANHKPVIRGTEYAIWRRIRLLPFTITIPPDEQDPRLPDKLRGELSGILSWAVRGCLDWQRNGLPAPDEVMLATRAYREEMDSLGHYLDDRCILNDSARAGAGELYAAYVEWAHGAGEHGISQKAFGLALAERGLAQVRGSRGRREWVGIGLLSDQGGDV